MTETLTSLCPPALCRNAAAEEPIVERLGAIGRDLHVIFLHATLTSDLTRGLPDLAQTWARFGDAQPPASFDADRKEPGRATPVRQFIAEINGDDPRPPLYFLHTLISHHPYYMLPGNRENKTWVNPPGRVNGGWDSDQPWAVTQQYQKHLLQTGFVDGLVGELVKRLRDEGLYDQALIIITADHGISHVPGTSLRSLAVETTADIMHVPLIVKPPSSMRTSARVSDVNAESVDILPTIADVVDVDVPWPIDGTSLLDPARRERPIRTMFSGGRRWSIGADGSNVETAVRRKLDLFGDHPANIHRAPRLPPHDQLVGRSVSELRVAEGGGQVELTHATEFDAVNPAAGAVVFDVGGRFASPRPDATVAVAINDVVAAVTRTWESNPRGWLATPKLDAWRLGANALEVFVIERDAGGLLLRRARFGNVRPANLNLISDAAADWGVLQSNFYPIEGTAGNAEFRWTRDWAELSNLLTHERPHEVQVDVAMVPGPPKVLRIEANRCTLFEGEVGPGWSRTFPLQRCLPSTEGLTLRFTTDAPRGQTDRRRLGVAISRVVLR